MNYLFKNKHTNMPLLQPASNSQLRRKSAEISPRSALPRPITSISAGRTVPGLPACPGSRLSGTQEAIAGKVTLGKLPAFHQKNLTKNQHVPHRTFQFLQNRHFQPSYQEVSRQLKAPCLCQGPLPAGAPGALLQGARRLQPGPRILALLAQQACKVFVRFPPHPVHALLLFKHHLLSLFLELQEKVRPQNSRAASHTCCLPLPPPLQLLAFTQLSDSVRWGYFRRKSDFSATQAHFAGLGVTRDLSH